MTKWQNEPFITTLTKARNQTHPHATILRGNLLPLSLSLMAFAAIVQDSTRILFLGDLFRRKRRKYEVTDKAMQKWIQFVNKCILGVIEVRRIVEIKP